MLTRSTQTHKSLNSFSRLQWGLFGLIGVIITSVILLIIALLLFNRIQDQKNDSYKSIDRAIKIFNEKQINPNIILFGSSALRMSSFLADRQHSYYVEDYNYYCRPPSFAKHFNSSRVEGHVGV